MDRSIPEAAKPIIQFIYKHESRGDYNCISSFKQDLLPKKITKMTVDEVLAAGPTWRKKYGTLSSAAGAPQIINKTLRRLKEVMNLSGKELFNEDLQDRMAMQLLRFRGYDAFMAGQITHIQFAKNLAMEWASMPVLAGTKNYKGQNIRRGQSYYAGDGMNAATDESKEFERILKAKHRQTASSGDLDRVLNKVEELPAAKNVQPAPSTTETATKTAVAVSTGAVVVGATEVTKSVTDWSPVIELARTLGTYGPWVAGAVIVSIAVVVLVRKFW